jgi:diadenosine tetraphosphate (Ap4A) HIT family hydrolase
MKKAACPFCRVDREVILASQLSFSIYDKFPVSPGHVLVIPRRHVEDCFDLSRAEVEDLWEMVANVRQLLNDKYNPGGFNVGFNSGTEAGQTIPHAHIHIIPRYRGDVEDPAGGIRNVIPGRGKY